MERFQLKAEQIVPDLEAPKSEEFRKSVIDDKSLSIIEPDQKYYDSRIDINLTHN